MEAPDYISTHYNCQNWCGPYCPSSSNHQANTSGMALSRDTCDLDCMFSNHRDLHLA